MTHIVHNLYGQALITINVISVLIPFKLNVTSVRANLAAQTHIGVMAPLVRLNSYKTTMKNHSM